jgi:hypothetical protein
VSQLKSSPVPIKVAQNDIAPKAIVTRTAGTGTPFLLVTPRNFGPWPELHKAIMVLEDA